MMKDNALRFLGICRKAQKLVSGDTAVFKAVQSGDAELVIIASDASDNTKKRFQDKCSTYGITAVTAFTVADLGSVTGHEVRAVCAVTDEGLAKAVLERTEVWQRSE